MIRPSSQGVTHGSVRGLRRVMVYTHNSIGLGHAIRCRAVISGMRHHRPDLDFLVLSGSALPQVFLEEQVEVLKLPCLRQILDGEGPQFQPRFLKSLPVAEIVKLRQRLILSAFTEYVPDAVLVEHYPDGLLGEALPLLEASGGGRSGGRPFALVHLGRGEPYQPSWPEVSLPGLPQLLSAYDLLYALSDPPAECRRQATNLSQDNPERPCYLGPVACRQPDELPPRNRILSSFGFEDCGLVLLSLGRGGPVLELARGLLQAIPKAGLENRGVVLVLDPYLEGTVADSLRELAQAHGAQAVPFVPYLIDVMAAADLVVCRAGYNTVVELMTTGTPALVVPEHHPSGEQEQRCRALSAEQIVVADESSIVGGGATELLRRAASLSCGATRSDFDRFAVGQRLVQDLEAWLYNHRRQGAS